MHNNSLLFSQFGQPKEVLQFNSSIIRQTSQTECLVKMHMAPINPSDVIPITGVYSHRIKLPLVAGYEGVGTIVKADNQALIGKRVLPLRGAGTWQNYVICNADWIIEAPYFISDDLACRGYINPLTAYIMLKKYNVKNKNIIITAAGSFCANIIAQWAKLLGANRIIGIYRSEKHIINLNALDIEFISIYDNYRISRCALDTDYVFDCVGGDLATFLLQSLNHNAKFISYGLLSRKMYQINPNHVLPERFHLRDYLCVVTKSQWKNDFKQIWNLLNIIKVPDIFYFSLVDWINALDYFEETGRQAKPVFFMEKD